MKMQKATRASRVLTQIEIIVKLVCIGFVMFRCGRGTSYVIEYQRCYHYQIKFVLQDIYGNTLKPSCKSFGSSMCYTATGLFIGFVGELLTFSLPQTKQIQLSRKF